MGKNKWLGGAVVLALSFFLSIILVKPIGVSTQFSVLSGVMYDAVDPEVITMDNGRESGYKSANAYYDKSDGKLAKEIKNPINYDFIFVLAIPLGSFIAYIISKKNKEKTKFNKENQGLKLIKPQKNVVHGSTKKTHVKAYVISFIGGFLLLFGSRLANGCTSGHMMSGMMQGSVSGYIFAMVVFIFAIPSALLFKKIIK